MPDINKPKAANHSIVMDNRTNIVVTGITEVSSYDSTTIVAVCDCGELVIQGKLLHIGNFDRVQGRMTVDGTVDAIQYINARKKSDSLLSRLLK